MEEYNNTIALKSIITNLESYSLDRLYTIKRNLEKESYNHDFNTTREYKYIFIKTFELVCTRIYELTT